MSAPDNIRREITVDAPLESVWALMSTPGWWVNDGEIIEHESSTEGDITTLHWKGVDFPIRTVSRDEPRTVVYEWGSGESADPAGERTRIEMTLTPAPAGVVVTVVESGFADYRNPEVGARTHAENSEGWETELTAAKTHLEA